MRISGIWKGKPFADEQLAKKFDLSAFIKTHVVVKVDKV